MNKLYDTILYYINCIRCHYYSWLFKPQPVTDFEKSMRAGAVMSFERNIVTIHDIEEQEGE